MSLAEWQRCQRCLWVFRYLKIIESDIDIEKGCAQKRTDQSVLLNGSFRLYILGYFSTKRCLPSGEQEWKTKEKSFVYQATKSWWPRQIIKHFPLKTYCCCFCFAAIVTGLQLSYSLVSLKANKVLLWFLKFVRFVKTSYVTLASMYIANLEKINVFAELFLSLNDDHPCFLSRTSSSILKLVSNSDWGTMTSSDRSSWFWLVWEANK